MFGNIASRSFFPFPFSVYLRSSYGNVPRSLLFFFFNRSFRILGFQEYSTVQSSDGAKRDKGGTIFVISGWLFACVYGRDRTTQDHATREKTRRNKVAALLSHQLPALPEEKCRAWRIVPTGCLCSRIIPFVGITIRPTFYKRSRHYCKQKCLSTWR